MQEGKTPRKGRVILVGAGPGDPELITLRGLRALRSADAVLYDELIARELLGEVPTGAHLVNVGKRGHEEPRVSQSEINEMLVGLASRGFTVVRLKGGDPFVFGRGGEELSACLAAGLPCEVVPGVSACVAAPGAIGIPVTDRRHAASFAVVTGHRDPGAAKPVDLAAIAASVDTLIVLMGMRRLSEILSEVAQVRGNETPAAAIMWGTTKAERSIVATVGTLDEQVSKRGLGAPTTVVIGDVVRLAEESARRP